MCFALALSFIFFCHTAQVKIHKSDVPAEMKEDILNFMNSAMDEFKIEKVSISTSVCLPSIQFYF